MTSSNQQSLPRVVHRYFEISLYLLVTVGFLALATTGRLDIPTLVLVGLALSAKALRYRHQQEPELPSKLVTVLTWFYFVFYLADLFLLSRDFLLATTHMVLFIAVVRMYSARTNRDYLWLAVVAFLELLAAATLTVDTIFLLFFLIFLVLAISTFVSFEIKRNLEERSEKQIASDMGGFAGRLPRALTLTAWSVMVGVLAIAGVIFFILPRWQAGYLSAYNFRDQRLSGFSNEVSLGDIGAIKRDPRVVMRIKAIDSDTSSMQGLHWRGISLAHFDGKTWTAPPARFGLVRSGFFGDFSLPFTPLQKVPTRQIRYRVLREPISTTTLFAAATPTYLQGRFQQLRYGPDRSLHLRQPSFSAMNYEVVSVIGYPAADVLRAAPSFQELESTTTRQSRTDVRNRIETLRSYYLQLPEVDPRVVQLTEDLTAPYDTVYEKAKVLENHLRTQYGYTLDLPDVPEEDPIASFLFERRQGHCEYFASSMAIMLRTQGIPARIVNGFLTGEYNEVSDNFIIRASDAHSWVEVFFPGIGWVEFDPTPADPNAPGRTMWTVISHYYDAFDLWWDEWVINYDIWQQVQMVRGVGGTLRDWTQSARHWIRQARRDASATVNSTLNDLLESPYTAPVVIALGVLIFGIFRGRAWLDWIREFRLLRNGAHGALSSSEATLVYQRMLRILRRRGFQKPPAQTPLEFAAEIPPPELSSGVEELTRLYNESRFGATATASTRLIALLRSVESWRPRSKQPVGSS